MRGQHSIRNRRISDLKVELEFKVRRARVLMSSREQSREIRTSSQSAPPLIISFAFTSEIQVRPFKEHVKGNFLDQNEEVALTLLSQVT